MAMRMPDGQYTATLYGLIRDRQYDEAMRILQTQLESAPQSRPALSLMGYCAFHVQDFATAVECYDQLTKLCPEVESYKVYYSQALSKAGLYADAMQMSMQVDLPKASGKLLKLQSTIKYEEGDVTAARTFVEQCPADDPDTIVNHGCLLYAEQKYDEAARKFQEAVNIAGAKAFLSYNMALCFFRTKQYAQALKHIADIIERGIREHPELSVGMTTEGVEVRSVGNTKVLHESALIEAFNLKAAIEYQLKNLEAAREALTDMPPRSEEELDHVTLHNQALMNMEVDATGGFEKLQFLLQQTPCPPETFGNLLLLYCKHELYDIAADVMAENADLTFKCLSQYVYEFLDAVITQQTAPAEAFKKFDLLATQHTDQLRKLTKQVQEARQKQDDEAVKRAVNDYDEALERYIPVLMAQAKIYWDTANYSHVEKIFRKSVEFCNEHDVWKLNVAHVLFMQEGKYREAIGFYEPIVRRNYEGLLDISAIVLANLCVSYIMTGQNEQAEEVMKKIEREEENVAYEDPDKKVYHLCIVNLVIGTLYCAKGNYQFGISRIMKSLEPYNRKLGLDTWFYAKRCFLALIEGMAKQMIMLNDATSHDVVEFFSACETHGKTIQAVEADPLGGDEGEEGRNTVAFEARYLKDLFLKVC